MMLTGLVVQRCSPWILEKGGALVINWVSCQAGRVGTWSQVKVNEENREMWPFLPTWIPEPRFSSVTLSHSRSGCNFLLKLFVFPFMEQIASEWALTSTNICHFPQAGGQPLSYSCFLFIFQTKLKKEKETVTDKMPPPQRCSHPNPQNPWMYVTWQWGCRWN